MSGSIPIFHNGTTVQGTPRASHILTAVSRAFGVSTSTLTLRSNCPEIVQPRQAAMWLIRSACNWSLSRIGIYFGGYDHTTVIHALAAVQARRKASSEYADALDHLRAEIMAGRGKPTPRVDEETFQLKND